MSQTVAHLVLASFLVGVVVTSDGCSKPVAPKSSSVGHESVEVPVSVTDPATAEPESDADRPESFVEVTDPVTHVGGPKDAEINSESLYRISPRFPELNRQRLTAAGIHVLESRRLVLLTDLDPETVRGLPHLADEYFGFLERVCGEVRPARSGVDFRATGCLMHNFELFQSVDLVPEQVVTMRHGQQFGYRFWMRDQPDDYYRRHLLLHEFAHVYMTCDTSLSDIPDGWFMEGAAEVFATHSTRNGVTDFGIMPSQTADFEGWGRISAIRARRVDRPTPGLARQAIPSVQQVRFPSGAPAGDDVRYAWWWALSWLLSNHPDYTDDWTTLCRCRGRDEFLQEIERMHSRHGLRLSTDWLLFAESLCEGFDTKYSFAKHREPDQSVAEQLILYAEHGWQDSGRDMSPGGMLAITCTGQCTIEETTAPWISEPNGVTLDYSHGRPLGEVVAVLVNPEAEWISQRIAVGNDSAITAPQAGRLWLQINDSASSRVGNLGSYSVTIHEASVSAEDDD